MKIDIINWIDIFFLQHKELATLYRLRQLFVKDLQARLKVVSDYLTSIFIFIRIG